MQPSLPSPFVEPAPPRSVAAEEQRFVLYGVPFRTYVTLRDALDETHSGLRMTYLEGTLEFMSPSFAHEDIKKMIARLLEIWALEMDIDLSGYGSLTLRKELKERGLEPDECYCRGPLRDVPDLAIEVIVSTGVIDKMAVYAGLGVPELWVWKGGALSVLRLGPDGYERRERSELLPELDLEPLVRFVNAPGSQTERVKQFRRALLASPSH